jgi:leucyl-tRNA synthetase
MVVPTMNTEILKYAGLGALANPSVQKHLDGKTIVKKIIVPDKIVNFVVK